MEALHFVDFEPLDKLYIMAAPTYGRVENVKIGISRNPWKRLKGCRAQYDHLLELVVVYEIDNARKVESMVKKRFKDKRCGRIATEWFNVHRSEVIKFLADECGVVAP